MAEYCFIRIPPGTSDVVEWIATDAEGRRIGMVSRGSLAQAAEKAGQRKLVLIVPGTEVVLTQVSLPVRSGARLRQAVPYALEEQLADDVDNLHFAIGKRSDAGHHPVAVTARTRMEGWLQRLQEAGLRAAIVVTDAACVPDTPGGFTVMIDRDVTYIHGPDDMDLVLEGVELDQALELAGLRAEDKESAAVPVNLYLGKEEHTQRASRIEMLAAQFPALETRVMVDGCLAHLAAGMIARGPVNLRQGDFAPRSSPGKLWKPWRLAAGLAAAVLLLATAGQGMQLFMLKKQERELDTRIEALFREIFPNVSLSGDPANQMRSRLQALRSSAGDADPVFLEALSALAMATSGQPAGSVDSISFRNGVLDLKLLVPSVDVLDRIRRNMEAAGGFEVELESANPSGNQVEGRIQMRRSGA